MRKKILKFWRFTFQGIAMASLGTMGLSPSWGAFILGLAMIFFAFAMYFFEGE